MLQATIITIPKLGKPSDVVTNYHPFSLLNSDLKISMNIAYRIKKILPSLIHPDLVEFVAIRPARDSNCRVLNLIQLVKRIPSDSILLHLDAEKAFDRVNLDYLSFVLTKFGFKDSILHVVLSLYTSSSARVFTSGFMSSPCNITNGTRQGCPLSPLIFALSI